MDRRIAWYWVLPCWLVSQSLWAHDTADLTAALEQARDGVRYRAVNRAELAQAESLFTRTLGGDVTSPALADAWQALGWELRHWQIEGDGLWTLTERPRQRHGRGVFVLRPDGQSVILQAPHSYHDKYTGEIARSTFLAGNFRVGAWNTVHRKTADAAHLEEHYMNALTSAAAQALTPVLVVQLHGFSQSRRDTQAGSTADLIASNGSKQPGPWFLRGAEHLRRPAFGTVRLYPYEVRELGGTSNQQAKTLRANGSDGFLHLEMSLRLRERLRADPSLCVDMANDISGVYRAMQ